MFKNYSNPLRAMAVLVCFLSSTASAEKTDIVVLLNGNAVTGEVKSLEFGLLKYGTDSMGTVSIDWEDIVDLSSQQHLQIELTDGTRYFGELSPTGDPTLVRVLTPSQEYTVKSSRVVRITPIETSEKFLERLDGSFSFGFQTQKSSAVTTSQMDADISYRTRKYLVGMRLNSTITDQSNTDDTQKSNTARQGVNFNYQRFRPNRWFTDWFTSWEKNDELGVAGRFAAGAALGRYLVQTNKNQFSLTGGIQGANSSYTGEDEGKTEAEGRVEIRYLRRNLVPETSIRFTSTIYPLLEDLSSYRAESDLSLSREFFDDFFLEISLGFSYLSEPPTGGEKSDYTATTSFGYSF
jgi:putative salt-induced outer membrane protein YdiY